MIEINFFEKKARNVLPHLMIVFFFAGVMIVGIYFFLMHGLYVRQDQNSMQLLQQRSEEVSVARNMSRVDRAITMNEQAMTVLEANQYPLVYLTEDITGVIPDSEETVVTFTLNETNELMVQLDQSLVEESAELITDLEMLPYVTRVHMTRLENQGEDAGHLIELTLDIDEQILKEEGGEQ
ncbi:hypothetical protein [Alkalibacterium pelagium]|uniref:Type IV pilus assembly protein PilN n=1 Tax=Alkalibacterium pelagium TaxID=426702 RepID=A0A1H7KV56_9LACT|nr:hypothetical protein [Alkalibacterium pelagium]GEN50655.1 hypothetical protein APE02nite_13200 [Alkalibacterium pelagium]SEK90410.1 hypothetical protein SAMN04488099_10848 [Alkalibacterium pelagium]